VISRGDSAARTPPQRRRIISSFWQRDDPEVLTAQLARPFLPKSLDLPVDARHLSHGLVLLVAAIVAVIGGVTASQRAQQEASLSEQWAISNGESPTFTRQEQALRARALPSTEGAVSYFRLGDDSAPLLPQTRTTVATYQTKSGDSTYTVAARFGVSVQTLVWANDLDNADYLPIGTEIVIPPTTGVLHTVRPGETLSQVAARYGVEAAAIAAYTPNGIADPNLLPMGRRIMVPGGIMPAPVRPVYVAPNEAVVSQPVPVPAPLARPAPAAAPAAAPVVAPAAAPVAAAAAVATAAPVVAAAAVRSAATGGGGGTGNFAWPTFGPIFTYFGEGTSYGYHEGIDISPPYGTPVYAADGGVVVDAEQLGWGLGWFLLIDHGNGFQTRYAHMSSFAVGYGQRVAKGQLIGAVGATGNATGPHLHFEIILGKTPVNPLRYLP
jgi:murein DD-endopeptidase MepM/ murein hydrolase activator NlpD